MDRIRQQTPVRLSHIGNRLHICFREGERDRWRLDRSIDWTRDE